MLCHHELYLGTGRVVCCRKLGKRRRIGEREPQVSARAQEPQAFCICLVVKAPATGAASGLRYQSLSPVIPDGFPIDASLRREIADADELGARHRYRALIHCACFCRCYRSYVASAVRCKLQAASEIIWRTIVIPRIFISLTAIAAFSTNVLAACCP